MLLSGRTLRRALIGAIGTGATAGAMLLGGASLASAQPPPAPPPPDCTAADLARVSAGVAQATSDYLYSHPDVNNFFTSLRGHANEDVPNEIQNYLNANPQVRSDLTGIRQPLTDLRNRCELPPGGLLPATAPAPPG
jgi:hemophore-related protein